MTARYESDLFSVQEDSEPCLDQHYPVLVWEPPHKANVRLEAVTVDKEIYPCFCKGTHATTVVRGSIDMVDTDGICAKFLHESGIELTLSGVHERVIFDQLVGNTCKP